MLKGVFYGLLHLFKSKKSRKNLGGQIKNNTYNNRNYFIKVQQLDTRRKVSMFSERIETFMVKFHWMSQQKTAFKNRRR
jgi:hypothetical protein